jgi:hypothetical protein
MIESWIKNSSERVFPNLKKFYYDTNKISLDSAKNMTVCAQCCLRFSDNFTAGKVSFEGLPKGVSARYNYQGYFTFNDGIPYPDIMLSDESIDVIKHRTQGLYIFFDIDKDAQVGTSKITAKVETSHEVVEFNITLRIYNVTLPEPCNSEFGHEYFFNPLRTFPFNGNPPKSTPCPEADYGYEMFSDEWFNYVGELAKFSKKLRINVLWIAGLPLLQYAGSKRISKEKWHFDFKYLEKYIDVSLKNGSYHHIVFENLIASVKGGLITGLDENGNTIKFTIPSEDAELWAKNFYSAIYEFFKSKNLLKYLMMHVQDEPHTSEYWIWGAKKCAEYMPGIPCSEPIDWDIADELIGHCHHYIPRIDVWTRNKKLYQKIQKSGDIVWCYSCCGPEEPHWLNKMIDLPFIYSRLMVWACYSQNITGFLHWGGNFWEDPVSFGLYPSGRYKGDGFIVYPDVEKNSLRMSNRGVQTIEGIQDWELLNMYAKHNPKEALRIAKKAAKSFTEFKDDAVLLDNLRQTLLTALEQLNQ